MFQKIKKNLDKNNISQNDKILCAVSGGIDSSVMLYALKSLNYNCVVAHCNFKLRDEESFGDENFVISTAEKYNLPYEVIRFDTHDYAVNNHLSTQVAARNLRYDWFYKIAEKYNCDYIAIAHNSDDQIETILNNLIRGTGIRGLTGMSVLSGILLRPLLHISRDEITKFASENNIQYRTDSTNLTTKYSRNKIRLELIPLMAEINLTVKYNILKSIDYFKDTEKILSHYVDNAKKLCLSYDKDNFIINIDILSEFDAVETVLYEILISENIPSKIANETIALLNSQTGKKIISDENYPQQFEIIRNRNSLLINKKISDNFFLRDKIFSLDDLSKYSIHYEVKNVNDVKINPSANFAFLDFNKISFPMIMKSWEHGDKFMPLGMNNFKKLSDFFVDNKFSLSDKDDSLLLMSNDDIIWIVGNRIDNRYKITDKTPKVLVLELKKD